MEGCKRVDLNPSRSSLDQKLYRHIVLDNGLQAILVQDATAMMQQEHAVRCLHDNTSDIGDDRNKAEDQEEDEVSAEDSDDEDEDDCAEDSVRSAACAFLVGVGSRSDPTNHQGLAHFLEHLLFMGSEKYPTENGYDVYISKAGGSDNACTEWNQTVYTFDLPHQQALPGALDRLAQFFIRPLMLETAVDRELKAIESEFQLVLNSDSARREQLLSALETVDAAGDDHPNETSFGPFSWGNIKALSNSYGALRTWFEEHYCPSRMRLVLQGAYSLDALEDMVQRSCGAIPRRGGSEVPVSPPMMSPGVTSVLLRIVPVKERHRVAISWKVPSSIAKWRTKSLDIISHLLGHEASGSAYAYLQSRAMATSCQAGLEDEYSPNVFSVSFDLTQITHWPSTVEVVMAYLHLLRKTGVPKYIFSELQHVAQLSYQHGNELSPEDTVETLADNMTPERNMDVEHLLSGSDLYIDFDAEEINTLLRDVLTCERCNIDVTSSEFGSTADYEEHHVISDRIMLQDSPLDIIGKPERSPQKEPWFGIYFWANRLPRSALQTWAVADPTRFDLHLPPPNHFIPRALALKSFPADDANHPLLHSALKICLPIGKQKQWFPVTVLRYDSRKNAIMVSFFDTDIENGDQESWYKLDDTEETIAGIGYDAGTLNQRQVPFRIVSTCPIGVKVALHPSTDDFPSIHPVLRRYPRQIVNSSALKLWWMQDRTFRRPLVDFRIEIVCKVVHESALHRAVADLLVERVTEHMTETCYLAELCELNSSIEAISTGFSLRFHGFDDQLLNLVRPVMSCLLIFRKGKETDAELAGTLLRADRFTACKDALEQRYKNTGMASSALADHVRLQSIRTQAFSANQKLKAIKNISLRTFASVAAELLSEFTIESFIYGNCTKSEALLTRDVLLELLGDNHKVLPKKGFPPQSILRIPLCKTPSTVIVPSRNPEESNTTCDVYFQVAKDNIADRVLVDLLIHLMETPMYDQLRTKDQVGYDVYCDALWSFGIIGCIFHVTTNVKSGVEILERIDSFLKQFRESLVEMSMEEFDDNRMGLACQKLEMPSSLSDEADFLWDEIHDGRLDWEIARNEAAYLQTVTKEAALGAFDSWLRPNTSRRVAVFQVIGSAPGDVSSGRPATDGPVDDYIDSQVMMFRASCKGQTWGKVTSRLF